MNGAPAFRVDAGARLGDFSLAVKAESPGGVTALLGPSGSGKTTFLGLLSGLIRPERGRVEIAGQALFDSTAGLWVPTHERPVGVVFQDIRLFPHLSVASNLTYARRWSGRQPAGPLASLTLDEVTRLLDIEDLLERRPASLSGGEAQRVALGRALLSSPRLLLLDEPLTAVDLELRDSFLSFLERVRDQLAIPMVYVSHNLAEVARLTDRAVVLRGGRVVGMGSLTDLAMDSPLAARSDLVNALRVAATEGDTEAGIRTYTLVGAPKVRVVGPPVRPVPTSLFIRPADVALALSPVANISIRNQLPGQVQRLVEVGGCVRVEVNIGQRLVAQVTRASAKALDLRPGAKVTCLFKTRAVS